MPLTSPDHIARRQGFTLIEVLVSLLVLAFGILGLASLQLFGLRNNQSALNRSQATQMAYDIADRMRSNPGGFDNGRYNKQAATNNDCEANSCTPTQMAGYDLAQWNAQIQTLPMGAGVVCIDSTPNDGSVAVDGTVTDNCDNSGTVYAVKVWWDDDRVGQALQRFVMSVQP
jgi:type IV pilus assembly protein PilV